MLTVTVTQNNETKQISASSGDRLLDALRLAGYDVIAPCGGNGTCGRCLALVDGSPARTCRYILERDCEVQLPDTDVIMAVVSAADDIAPGAEGLGVAADIGTTTVAAYLYDLASGKLLGAESGRSAQRVFGSDVISRIQRCGAPGGLEALAEAIRGQLSGFIDALCLRHGRKRCDINLVSIAGNTVMEHIFAGLSPVTIGVAPYKILSLFGDTRPAGEMLDGLSPSAELYICPAISGYVGGDITAGLFASGAESGSKTTLFLDIGTNGEMALGGDGGFLCCAAAAGPAFEGAEIECGMDGARGAISRVWAQGGDVVCGVIGGGEAKGICGSGLIDALAAMLKLSVVDETGRMRAPEEFLNTPLSERVKRGEKGDLRFYLANGVYFSAADVRQLQLAKAAIRAGVDTLLEAAGKKYDDVAAVLIAGGFGSYMDVQNASAIGLIPPAFLGRVRHVGNSAGAGASLALSPNARAGLSALAAKCEYVELSDSSVFMEKFIESIPFWEGG